MVYEKVLEGKYVDLKACTEDDAEFTLSLRMDPKLGKYFPKVEHSVNEQKVWIRSQREKDGDYFFVVWNKAGDRIGTIAIYNIENGEGEGGRIIIKSKDAFDVFEAQMLLDKFAFDILGLNLMKGFIFSDNKRAIRFSKQVSGKFFAPEIDENGRRIIRVETTKEDFMLIYQKMSNLIYV